MFEQELEMERRESSIIPVVLILALAGIIVGSIVYWVLEMRNALKPEQASGVVTRLLNTKGPVALRFHTGVLGAGVEDPSEPHYRLLEKAGLITITKTKPKGKGKGKAEIVTAELTPAGEEMFKAISGFDKRGEPDGTVAVTVPLATKKVVHVSKVDMTGPNIAFVRYTWKWDTTPLGDIFDAGGPAMRAVSVWDTEKLIQKYNANFYHGEAVAAGMKLVKADSGTWRVAD